MLLSEGLCFELLSRHFSSLYFSFRGFSWRLPPRTPSAWCDQCLSLAQPQRTTFSRINMSTPWWAIKQEQQEPHHFRPYFRPIDKLSFKGPRSRTNDFLVLIRLGAILRTLLSAHQHVGRITETLAGMYERCTRLDSKFSSIVRKLFRSARSPIAPQIEPQFASKYESRGHLYLMKQHYIRGHEQMKSSWRRWSG